MSGIDSDCTLPLGLRCSALLGGFADKKGGTSMLQILTFEDRGVGLAAVFRELASGIEIALNEESLRVRIKNLLKYDIDAPTEMAALAEMMARKMPNVGDERAP